MEARLLQTRISAVPYLFKVQQGIRDAVVGITYLSLPKTGDLWPRGAFPVPGNRPLPCPADEAPREIRTNTAGRPSQGPEGRRRPILAEIPTNGDTIEQILSGGRCLSIGMAINGTWDKRKGLPGAWSISGYRKGLYGLPEEQGWTVVAILGRTDAFTGLPRGRIR